jgi:MFS family permease
MLAGLIAFRCIHLPGGTWLFLLLFAPGFGGLTVLRGSFMRQRFGRRSLGKLLGIVFGSGSLGGIIGPTLAGWLFDRTGTYHVVWLVFAACVAVAAFLISKAKE